MTRRKWERYAVITLLVLLAVVLGGSMVLAGTYHFMAGRAAAGVQVMGEDLGGMTSREVETFLQEQEAVFARQDFQVQVGEEARTFTAAEAGVSLDVPGMTGQVLSRGNRGNLPQRMTERYQLSRRGESVPLVLKQDQERLDEFLDDLAREVEQEPVSARFEVEEGEVKIVPSEAGRALERDDSRRNLLQSLSRLEQEPVELSIVEAEPEYTTEELEAMEIDHRRASYSTNFYAGASNRNHNIGLAAEALKGRILRPGEALSFNETVGPRTSEAGFLHAPVIVDGEMEPGLGGGVCQVSSTLYNAGLLGNLEIKEQRGHSLTVGYVPLGRDATVVYGAIDLQLKNSLDHDVFFWTSVDSNSITIELYGQDTGEEVTINTSVNSVIGPSEKREQTSELPRGETRVERQGSSGYVVSATRVITYPDGRTETESLGSHTYRPRPRLVLVGTAEPPREEREPDKPQPDGNNGSPEENGNSQGDQAFRRVLQIA